MSSSDLLVILPEIILAAYALLALLGAAYTSKDGAAPTLLYLTAAMFFALALWIGLAAPSVGPREGFAGLVIDDGFSRFAKIMVLVSAGAVLLISKTYMERRDLLRFEFPLLIALSVIGMMIMVSAGDLMTLYMGLELQSLSLYVVAALRRDSVRSTEAGLKYFVLGALSSGLLLYGASLTYGYAGTTEFSGIVQAAGDGQVSLGLLFGLVFLIAGLGFKVSAAPFHMWTPDVYEGSPTPVTAFFATAPKVAAMALLARLMHGAFAEAQQDWTQVVAILSVASMFLGAFAAIGQTNIKRLMAYSSITHMGFALMGLAAGTAFGLQAMLVYMAIYVTMNVGTFAFIMSMSRDGQPVTDTAALNNYSEAEPLRALAMMILLFSLAGVPPLVGFFGKFYVLRAAFDGGMAWLAVAGVIASVIAAFYYLRLVYFMYFGQAQPSLDRGGAPILTGFLVASAAAMVVGVINLFGIETMAATAAAALVQ